MDRSLSAAEWESGAAAFPRQFALTRRFALGTVRNLSVPGDGTRVLFVRTGDGADPVSRLWLWEDGAERELAGPGTLGAAPSGPGSEPERAARERTREQAVGVTDYAADSAGSLVAFTVGGALWAVRTAGGPPFRVPVEGPVTDPRPSPDGTLIAYVREGTLCVVSPAGPDQHHRPGDADGESALGARELAVPEGPGVTYGLTDHVAAESMGRLRGHWWAPDGSALLVARVDTARVARRWLSDPAHPERPPRAIPYPAAGTANAEVTLHLVRLDGTRTEVDTRRTGFEYVATARWDGWGPLVTVQSRDQRTVLTLAADPADGSTEVLDMCEDEHWVELVPGTPCRTESGALVRTSDEGDTRRLTVAGTAVTPPGLQVQAVLGTDGEAVWFSAVQDPTVEHVWRWSPGAAPEQVSRADGVHGAAVGRGTVVLDGLTPRGQRVTVLRAGRAAGGVDAVAEEPALPPEPLFLTLGERGLRAALYLPSWCRPGTAPPRSLPVLLNPYSGPGMRLVVRARHWASCVSRWFAEQGFAVLVTDGRGTPGRGPAWEKAVRGDQLTPVLEDQRDALRAAAVARPFLDLDRVAIRGWSFSGTLAAAAVLRHPDVFHAAVAGAGPSEQRLYDTHWKERFLGHPDQEPGNYDSSSLIQDAPLLRRPLLLIHGTDDDNVAFAHTLRLSAALLAAGRDHSVLPLPGASHLVRDEAAAEQLLPFQARFLKDALAR
ncbi:S9 family peptidase [Streptomyces iconiensis]|uniref:Prolyl oligopeptidase family serine peptidase n=1 Tax=Streptomyces iconiensis TaxID=1384038 RepID=A0ABT7A2X3_9ACTN|nr:prolyl oligopeptidase family serine peptidase [Streptomyces iconiensis]MDJ1135680.1 prolyl oligopeptidase family serine peptidase [Streptomyces iconiensis]